MPAAKISEVGSALGAAPASGDLFPIVDVSDTSQSANGTTKRVTMANVIDAVEANANTFTNAQAVNSTATNTLILQRGGVARIQNQFSDVQSAWVLVAADFGVNVGPFVSINNNNNASTPAAGAVRIANQAGSGYFIWPDASGNLRISTTTPTNANDTAGTVIGTQTSWHALKENVTEWDGGEAALDAIRALSLYSYQMIEDGQRTPNGEKPTYYGIVIQQADRDANAWFGLGYAENQTPVLNDRNLFGYLLAAVQHGGNIINALQDQVAALEARVEALEGQ